MSRHEGFGVPLVDALAFGKHLSSTRKPGMMETAGEAAIIVEASNPEAVATALGAALDDDNRARAACWWRGVRASTRFDISPMDI